MIDTNNGHWRWHAGTTWHYHASMIYAMNMVPSSDNEFFKYYYIRSCLYFAYSAAESHLNSIMRSYLNSTHTEDDVYKTLRNTSFKSKLKICSDFCKEQLHLGQIAADVRHEVTHPKRYDHSIYTDMDDINLEKVADDLSLFIVSAQNALGHPFPYWVLGWNYVSNQFGRIEVVQSNNMNGFYWSMKRIGLVKELSHDIHWEDGHMRGAMSYKELKSTLGACHKDIEPFCSTTPHKERLTRRWWDHDFIRTAWNRG